MKISLNEIKKYVTIPSEISTEELIKLIGSRLVEVEGHEDWSKKFRNIYIVKVIECEDIPDTHLHLCQIDAGKEELIQVVCGAPNVHAGMLAAWIAPGAIVPSTFGTDEPFEISARKLRGYMSNGMLAASDELSLGADHDGIIEIDPEMECAGKKVAPGDSFAEVFDLNDIILDIENKSLTHRPDTFGLIGFAREVAGILGTPFEGNYKYSDITCEGGPQASVKYSDITCEGGPQATGRGIAAGASVTTEAEDRAPNKYMSEYLEISITDASLCPRYSCAIMNFPESPAKKYFTEDDVFLAKAGMHAISPIVDITNILMLRTGQPLHAFDYDKFVKVGGLDTPKIIVRAAKNGEQLELLDGKIVECDENDILITSNDVPVALAGAMGGENTKIDENTKHIILESASFSLYHLRKTQMKHGIFSEAITRFTKGQPSGLTMPVLEAAISTLGESPISIIDDYPVLPENQVITITPKEINSLLGSNYDEWVISKTLENVGFKVTSQDDVLEVTAPFWRTDIHIKEDIIEEVGRLLGYDNIAIDYPTRPFIGSKVDPLLKLKTTTRNILSDRLAAHEVLTYSFVSKKLLQNVGENPEDSYEIVNSISPELQCFRQSLVPSLLEKLRDNLKSGYKDFALYEINQATRKSLGLNSENVPNMQDRLALVASGDYYVSKQYLVNYLADLGLELIIDEASDSLAPYFEPQHSATVSIKVADDTITLGCIGEIKSGVAKRLKVGIASAFEIDLNKLLEYLPKHAAQSQKISKFPSVGRDLTLKVAKKTKFAEVENAIKKSLDECEVIYTITPVSIYQKPDTDTKNLSFHLDFASLDHTLNSAEISDIMNKVNKTVITVLGAEVV